MQTRAHSPGVQRLLGQWGTAGGPAARGGSLADLRTRYVDDFLGFVALLEIIPKTPGAGPVAFIPNEVQLAYCKVRTARDIILKARQVGFTTIEQARDLWFFLTRPSASVKVVCQSSADNAALNGLSKRFNVMLASLRKRGWAISFASERTGRWQLSDADGAAVLEVVGAGSSAMAAEKKGRSDTVHRLHITEVAFFEYAGKTLNALLECVPSAERGSEIVFESTPNGAGADDRGDMESASGGPYFFWWCQDARRGVSGFAFHFVSWMQDAGYRTALEEDEEVVPETDREQQIVDLGATSEQLKWYRQKVATKGQDHTDQEYASDPDTCFLVSGRQFFDKPRTTALITIAQGVKPIEDVIITRAGAVGRLKVWLPPDPTRRYVASGDTSEGTGSNRGAGQVWEHVTGRHMATLLGQFKPAELARELERLGYRYNLATIAVERNNHGHACIQELERAGVDADGTKKTRYPKIFHDTDRKAGWINHEVSRSGALTRLEQAHREGHWSTVDLDTLGEVRTFVVHKNGKAAAATGANDDLVITAAIAWEVLSRLPTSPAPAPPPIRTSDPNNRPLLG